MAGVTCKVVDQKVLEFVNGLGQRIANVRPVLKTIGEIIRSSVVRNFEEGGRPTKWKPSKRATDEGGITLSDTGRLRNSIHATVGQNQVTVGTNVIYAAIQQFGGKTKPHVIQAPNGKALFWPGAKHPVFSVQHPGSNIPARPFLMIQDSDWDEIKETLKNWAVKGQV